MPTVSVLLPIYRESDEYVKLAIESIQNQTFRDTVIMVRLDDPDNDRLKALMSRYVNMDKRIVFSINRSNLGLPETLNKMLDEVHSPFTARMDADDISLPDRIEKQYKYMIQHPETDLCGTNIIYINADGNETHRKCRLPNKRKEIKKSLQYIDVFCHPTFFAKSDVIKRMKYRNLKYSQDYDLVCRMVEQGCNLTNINEYLLRYRTGSVSQRKLFEQRIIAGEIQKYYKKGCLSVTDITKDIFDKVNASTEKQIYDYWHSCEIYEKGVIALKKRSYMEALKGIGKSFFCSKYQRENILHAIIYRGILVRNK